MQMETRLQVLQKVHREKKKGTRQEVEGNLGEPWKGRRNACQRKEPAHRGWENRGEEDPERKGAGGGT